MVGWWLTFIQLWASLLSPRDIFWPLLLHQYLGGVNNHTQSWVMIVFILIIQSWCWWFSFYMRIYSGSAWSQHQSPALWQHHKLMDIIPNMPLTVKYNELTFYKDFSIQMIWYNKFYNKTLPDISKEAQKAENISAIVRACCVQWQQETLGWCWRMWKGLGGDDITWETTIQSLNIFLYKLMTLNIRIRWSKWTE